MSLEGIIFDFAAIFIGAAALASVFLFTKQPIILAYIAVGACLGPSGFRLIDDPGRIEQISRIGVILLLFLVGLDLQPRKLVALFRHTSILTLATSLVFGAVSCGFGLAVGLAVSDAAVFGLAMMFSSTVVGLKLVPTTTLHQKRAGELMTSVLIVQDVLAILVILFLTGNKGVNFLALSAVVVGKFALLCGLAYLGVRAMIFPLLQKFDVIEEYMFVMTIGWCMLCAQAGHFLGLSHEMGAFIGGLAMASHRVALVIAVHLKPLREFFLILFFFAVGAGFELMRSPRLLLWGIFFGGLLVVLKAQVFRFAFHKAGEPKALSEQLGVRLGQASEFSFLVAFAAVSSGILSANGEILIEAATIATFVLSTYWVVRRYPTPISSH